MAEIENPSVVQPPTNSNAEPEWHAPVLISFESRDAEGGTTVGHDATHLS
jgi:hypothetical protein